MRPALVVALAILFNSTANAAEVKTGSFKCKYIGNWHCADNGICIDSVRKNVSRPTLEIDFEKHRISLNGLDGRLERQDLADGFWVYWQVGGLGLAKLSATTVGDKVFANLSHQGAKSRGAVSSEFQCDKAD